jgi:cellulose synthase/poly-beta-1,6-N-acetylglucosamine synthase-like glycosyltransferase
MPYLETGAELISHSGKALAIVTFWGSVALIFYTYLGYPLLLKALALFITHKSALPTEDSSLTLLICAHNEEQSIEAKLLNSLALDYPRTKLQIIVVSDGSTDATDELVQCFADRGVELIRINHQMGKTNAQNVAMAHAMGEIVIFSDATTLYEPDALRLLAGNFSNPAVGACSGRYVYVNAGGDASNSSGAKVFAGYDNTVRALQSQVWGITGCCGCIYSVRRSLYTPLEPHIISDLVQPLHVLKQGYRVTLEPGALAREVTASTSRQEFSMRVRVIARALAGLYSVRELLVPWRSPWIAFQLWSHKLLRWSVSLMLIGIAVSSAFLHQIPFFRVAVLLQLVFYSMALLGAFVPLPETLPILRLPLYFCTINAAALAGFMQFIRGNRYVSWRPVREDAHAS